VDDLFRERRQGGLYTPALARELEATDSLALMDAAYEAFDAATFAGRPTPMSSSICPTTSW
jgi:hypothetical protein